MIDARGLSCPMPVIMVQQEVKKTGAKEIDVLVDNPVAVENITRFANNAGYRVTCAPDGDEFRLRLEK